MKRARRRAISVVYTQVYSTGAPPRMSAFLRLRLIKAEVAPAPGGARVDTFAAVSIKETEQSPQGPVIVQKKKTFYPDWGKCFDSHLVSGRRMMVNNNNKIIIIR